MVGTKHVRDIFYAGPGEVGGELGDHRHHILSCYCGAGNMEIYEGESGEQEVACHG